jgi:hypothetical protein
LKGVQWWLQEESASSEEKYEWGVTALHLASGRNHTVLVQWLIEEAGVGVLALDKNGHTALRIAIEKKRLRTAAYLVEHGGASISEDFDAEEMLWKLVAHVARTCDNDSDKDSKNLEIKALLQCLSLCSAPPDELVAKLSPKLQQIVKEGARMRAWLPAYLAQRRALLIAHCPLIAPLTALVNGYDEPTTTAEIWAKYGSPSS